jgi:AraC-like DNA-binding protein
MRDPSFRLTFAGTQVHNYYDQAQQQLGVSYIDHGRERALHFPAQLGKGTIRTLCLRDGVTLVMTDVCPLATLEIDWASETNSPFFELHLHLHGTSVATFDQTNAEYRITGGEVGCSYINSSEISGRIVYSAQQRVTMVEVSVQAPAFEQLGDQLPIRAARQTLPGFHLQRSALTPTMQAALYQVLQCPFTGAARQIYLEGKALELLGLYLAEQCSVAGRSAVSLRPDDVDRIHAAKTLLLTQLDNPPTLIELARQVGMNDCKLKSGFKQVFGTTVFGCLHAHRMEQAHQLLLEGRLTVLEVALAVGYASPSRFSVAFKQTFGVNPSALGRTTCKRSVYAPKLSRSA